MIGPIFIGLTFIPKHSSPHLVDDLFIAPWGVGCLGCTSPGADPAVLPDEVKIQTSNGQAPLFHD